MLNLDFYGLFDYDETGGDTYQYTSEEFSSLIAGITGNGISANTLNQFEPAANGLTISVASGAAFIEGRWGYNSTSKTITLSPTTSTTKRIDRIAIELDVDSRVIGLTTIAGTATTGTPVAPEYGDNMLPLCSVLIANGSTTTLTDERVFTYAAAEVQKQLNDIKAKLGNLDYLPLTGGTVSGQLNAKRIRVAGDNDYPTYEFKANSQTNYGAMIQAGSTNMIGFYEYPKEFDGQSTRYYEGYRLPEPDTGLTANKNYKILTTKVPVSVAQGGTGATDAAAARANLETLLYKKYDDGGLQSGAGNGSAWLTYTIGGTNKCQLDLGNDGRLRVNNTEVITVGGGATITGDMTFSGNLWVSNSNSASGYVKIWEDNEGGNIEIASPNGKTFQIDAYNNTNLRVFSEQSGSVKGVVFNGTNGNLSVDGDIKCANIQVGVADNVGTSGTTITFPHAFSGVPVVTANGSKQTSIRVYDITKTSCKLVSGESNNVVQWQAIYMG